MNNNNAPTSRSVTVGRTDSGSVESTVTQQGHQSLVTGREVYTRELAMADANLAPLLRQQAHNNEIATKRNGRVDPVTGEQGFQYTPEERKNAKLRLEQVERSIAFQRAQAHERASQVQAETDNANANTRAEYETVAAINKRADEIMMENAAKALARKLTISGK